MNRTRRWPVLLVGVGVLLVAGCGGSDGSDHRAASSSSPIPLGDVSGGQDPFDHGPVTIRGAAPGGTVHVLTAHPPSGSLDPALPHDDAVTSLLSGLVTRSLVQWKYDPVTDSTALVGDLATTTGSHNDDYTRWQFDIRPHAAFQDGTPVTARLVVRGIDRCLAQRASVGSPCHDVPIREVRVRYHDSVRLDLDRPDPELPWQVTSPAFGPLEGGAHRSRADSIPRATGPYEVAAYRPGRRLVLVRNPAWQPRSDAGRTAYPTRFVVEEGGSPRRISRLIRSDRGNAQTALTYDSVPVRPSDRRHWRQGPLVLGPAPCTTYLVPDEETLDVPRVRKALAWAYPYRAMVRSHGLVPGITAVPASAILPPLDFPPEGSAFKPPHAGFATSPLTARAILERAGRLGTTVRISAGADPALPTALTAAGFTPESVTSGPVDLQTRTVCAHGSQGEAWLRSVYADHPALVHRLHQVERQPLDQQRAAWVMRDRVALRVHWWVVPLWHHGVAMAHGSRITGMVDDPELGMPVWSNLSVSP